MKTLSEIWENGNVVKETPLADDGVIIIYELEGKQYKIRNNNKGDIIKLSGLDDGTPIYYNITYDEYLKLSNYANGGDIKKHWDKEYRDGGNIKDDFDSSYWLDYNNDNYQEEFYEKSKDFNSTFEEAIDEWNSVAESEENEIHDEEVSYIKNTAKKFFNKEKWISISIIHAMIAQEAGVPDFLVEVGDRLIFSNGDYYEIDSLGTEHYNKFFSFTSNDGANGQWEKTIVFNRLQDGTLKLQKANDIIKRNKISNRLKEHLSKKFKDGGSISSDRRFTEWDFNKLMASDKFRAVWSGNLWEIIEEGRTRVLGKFNPKTKSLYISGDKNMNNFLVVWMTENGFVNADEYAILANGGGVGNDWFWNHAYRHYMRDASLEQRNQVKEQFIKEGLELDGESPRHSAIISSIVGEYANGGGVERIDLFEDYENIPSNIQEILDEYSQDFEDGNYDGLAKALEEVESQGYTFEYYLDGQAYGLRPIGVPLNELKGYEDMGEEEYANGGGIEDGSYERSLVLKAITGNEDFDTEFINLNSKHSYLIKSKYIGNRNEDFIYIKRKYIDDLSVEFKIKVEFDSDEDGVRALENEIIEVEGVEIDIDSFTKDEQKKINDFISELKYHLYGDDLDETEKSLRYAGGGAVGRNLADKIIKKLKDKGYSFGDNLKLTEKFNGKEINLNFYFKFVQGIDEIKNPIFQIEIISKYLDFDRVDGLYETDDVLDWKLYKGKNLVCSMGGYWDEYQQPTVIKIGDIESSVFNFFPDEGNTDISLDTDQFEKNLKNALNEIKQKNLYSAVVSLEGYEQYSEKVDGLENAKQAIQDIKENTRFQVVKGDVASGDLIKQDEVIENYANGGGIKEKELWFSPYGEVKAEKRGTAKNYIEKHLAKSFGAEYMELVGEDEKDYIYELNGNPMMIAAKTAILQEETDLDIETYGRKKRVHIPKKSIDQTSVHLRYPLITPFKNGGYIKTDFNELENTELRNVLISFWNDFFTNHIGNYLSIEKENYILSNIDNVFVIVRDEDKGNFSDVEKQNIDRFLSPYFDSDKKPLFTDFFNNYEIKDNKIIIYINDMYANGGGVKKVGEYKEGMWIFLEFYNLFIRHDKEQKRNKRQKKGINIEYYNPPIHSVITSSYDKYLLNPHKYEYLRKYEKFANGGGVDYDTRWAEMEAYSPYTSRAEYENKKEYEDLAFASKTFSKTSEILVRENLNNGEICMCKLTKILGHEPNYPIQIVGSLKLEKCFLKRFYRIV